MLIASATSVMPLSLMWILSGFLPRPRPMNLRQDKQKQVRNESMKLSSVVNVQESNGTIVFNLLFKTVLCNESVPPEVWFKVQYMESV